MTVGALYGARRTPRQKFRHSFCGHNVISSFPAISLFSYSRLPLPQRQSLLYRAFCALRLPFVWSMASDAPKDRRKAASAPLQISHERRAFFLFRNKRFEAASAGKIAALPGGSFASLSEMHPAAACSLTAMKRRRALRYRRYPPEKRTARPRRAGRCAAQ